MCIFERLKQLKRQLRRFSLATYGANLHIRNISFVFGVFRNAEQVVIHRAFFFMTHNSIRLDFSACGSLVRLLPVPNITLSPL